MERRQIPINQIVNCDCRAGLRSLADDSIPLTVTSPPWDRVRRYGHGSAPAWNSSVFQEVADQLWRVTAPGGVVCWHVSEQVKNWSESGTTSEQRLYFRDIGFCLYQTLIIETISGHTLLHRYGTPPQFVFVLSKGRPSCLHLLKDRPNKTAGRINSITARKKDGTIQRQKQVVVAECSLRGSVWRYRPGRQLDDEARLHPAAMHEPLARDLIVSFSNPGQVVCDPFAGSGTTLKQALLNGRHFLGFEAVADYCDLARSRLSRYRKRLTAGAEDRGCPRLVQYCVEGS